MTTSASRREIQRRTETIQSGVAAALRRDRAAVVVQAPPGSGKTHLLIHVVQALRAQKLRVAIATQTNAQADDLCRRLAQPPVSLASIRFLKQSVRSPDLPSSTTVVRKAGELPTGPCIVVGNTTKWGMSNTWPFDVLLVDEAWQMSWATFMPLGPIAPRFVLIGDPGQIPPVASVDTQRWETARTPPHRPAPELILSTRPAELTEFALPASRRLPNDSVALIQSFYRFPFAAWAAPGDRAVLATGRATEPVDRALDKLRDASTVIATLPTPEDGPVELDEPIAALAARFVRRLLDRNTDVRMADADTPPVRLQPEDIGIAATHRIMNAALESALPAALRGRVRVDTPERWQGLQRKLMIVVHPLSCIGQPSAFDLETGRLCVMASRHQGGLVILSRDHVGETLDGLLLSADQPVGVPDVAGRGQQQNLAFWTAHAESGRIVDVG